MVFFAVLLDLSHHCWQCESSKQKVYTLLIHNVLFLNVVQKRLDNTNKSNRSGVLITGVLITSN